MNGHDELLIKAAVAERLVDYWWNVDRDDASDALSFYTDDCIYQMCDHRMQGHAPVVEYYAFRRSRGARLVRHVLTNVRVRVHGPDRATLHGVLSVYAADGEPVLPITLPIMLADTSCEFVVGADGHWRMREHRITALFAGGVKVLVPPPTA